MLSVSVFRDTVQVSRGKFNGFHCILAESTHPAFDDYGLCNQWLARPIGYALYSISVRRVATSIHASFRPSLAATPLRFTTVTVIRS